MTLESVSKRRSQFPGAIALWHIPVFMSLCLYVNRPAVEGWGTVGDASSIGVSQGAVRRVGQLYRSTLCTAPAFPRLFPCLPKQLAQGAEPCNGSDEIQIRPVPLHEVQRLRACPCIEAGRVEKENSFELYSRIELVLSMFVAYGRICVYQSHQLPSHATFTPATM